MKVIIFTLPEEGVPNEASRITVMLESGVVDRVHIRKPTFSAEKMRKLISEIDSFFHSQLSIHNNPELLLKFPGIGWHFSDNRPVADCSGTLSRSCHSLAEAKRWVSECDYVTLSPVFDSISKPGYKSVCFNPIEEIACNQLGTVIALGGVKPQYFPILKKRGYKGAAMLGYAWKTDLSIFLDELKFYKTDKSSTNIDNTII